MKLINSGGYKGYGLAMLVEILTSVLGGATMAPNVRKWSSNNVEANLVLITIVFFFLFDLFLFFS